MTVKIIESQDDIITVFKSPVAVVFKHSTRCPVSLAAKREFDIFSSDEQEKATIYIIDVIRNRHESMQIAEKSGVAHQSPQVLILKSGEVVWHESHWAITAEAIHNELRKIK